MLGCWCKHVEDELSFLWIEEDVVVARLEFEESDVSWGSDGDVFAVWFPGGFEESDGFELDEDFAVSGIDFDVVALVKEVIGCNVEDFGEAIGDEDCVSEDSSGSGLIVGERRKDLVKFSWDGWHRVNDTGEV